jgi:hypothetical protein
MLALLNRKVSFFKASRRLSPNSSLLELGVRSYIACHAMVLAINDKDEWKHINEVSLAFMLIKEVN